MTSQILNFTKQERVIRTLQHVVENSERQRSEILYMEINILHLKRNATINTMAPALIAIGLFIGH